MTPLDENMCNGYLLEDTSLLNVHDGEPATSRHSELSIGEPNVAFYRHGLGVNLLSLGRSDQ